MILILAAGQGRADICEEVRPDWTPGTPVAAWEEALMLLASPLSILLLIGTALALRTRSPWGGLVAVVGWSVWVTLLSVADPGDMRAAARAEGCIGSPALFIALVAAICVGTILYTAPLARRD